MQISHRPLDFIPAVRVGVVTVALCALSLFFGPGWAFGVFAILGSATIAFWAGYVRPAQFLAGVYVAFAALVDPLRPLLVVLATIFGFLQIASRLNLQSARGGSLFFTWPQQSSFSLPGALTAHFRPPNKFP